MERAALDLLLPPVRPDARRPVKALRPGAILVRRAGRRRRKENVITITGPRGRRQGGRKSLQIQLEGASMRRKGPLTWEGGSRR